MTISKKLNVCSNKNKIIQPDLLAHVFELWWNLIKVFLMYIQPLNFEIVWLSFFLKIKVKNIEIYEKWNGYILLWLIFI